MKTLFYTVLCLIIYITVTPAIAEVKIPDSNLRKVIEETLGIVVATITKEDMSKLDTVNGRGKRIEDLTGLEYAVNLRAALFEANHIVDITPLKGLPLEFLYLSQNPIKDISIISSLPHLIGFAVSRTTIADLSPLKEKRFWSLTLNEIGLTEIPPLAHPETLRRLYIADNKISNISVLENFINLEVLGIGGNQIIDITPTAHLMHIEKLYINKNSIEDITPLKAMSKLQRLWAFDNKISDLTPLSDLINIADIWISGNPITDISPIANLTKLQRLWIGNSLITDISPLKALKQLEDIGIAYNLLVDISPLENLTQLKRLYLDYNQISDISALSNLTQLEKLYLTNNQISDVSAITNLTALDTLHLSFNNISNVVPMLNNQGFGEGDYIAIYENPLGYISQDVYIPMLENRGVQIIYDVKTPPTDINQDGEINVLDLIMVANAINQEGEDIKEDINKDGVVGILDLVLVSNALGEKRL